MTVVSDIFAFATENADYWSDLLSGEDYPPDLTEDERKALDAALRHIDAIAVELLQACGAAFVTQAGQPWSLPAFKRKSTADNRLVKVPPPAILKDDLYFVIFQLGPSLDRKRVVLWSSLSVKKRAAATRLTTKLKERKIEHHYDGYHIYGSPVSIAAGRDLSALASEVAQSAANLLRGCDLLGTVNVHVAEAGDSGAEITGFEDEAIVTRPETGPAESASDTALGK